VPVVDAADRGAARLEFGPVTLNVGSHRDR